MATSLSFGRTSVASQRRSVGTNRNVPTMPSATPAIRYSTVASGTKCERSVDAPATVLKKISNARWMITCTDLLQCHRRGGPHRAEPALLQEPRAQRQPADPGRGGGRGKSVGHLRD